MKQKIYGNRALFGTVEAMLKSGRLAHSFLLYGEKGLGKKTIAGKIACMLTESEGHPAESINPAAYPDIIHAEHSGARQGFSAETVRNICGDAYLAPNNGARKVYLFEDCDNISIPAQNALLKLIEEPPEFTYFIFTAGRKEALLSTVLSRVVSLGVTECSREDTVKALMWEGIPEEEAAKAAEQFCGNIGKALDFCRDGELRQMSECAAELLECAVCRQEYRLLKLSTELEGSRQKAQEALRMAGTALRDCLAAELQPEVSRGCCPELSRKLSSKITPSRAQKFYALFRDTAEELDSNVQVGLALYAFCGKAMDLG